MVKTAPGRLLFPVILAGVLSSSIPIRELSADEFRRHVVVSQQGDASVAGRDVLRAGGNAVDAAVATAFALAVTHPAAGNLGGGGFIVAYRASTREVFTFDFRETAPLASTPRMYLGADGRPLPGHRAGPRAAGVPGTVRGLALAHSRLGHASWDDLLRPAIRLAREGFTISETLARGLNGQLFDPKSVNVANVPEDLGDTRDRMSAFPSSIRAYRKPDGTPWARVTGSSSRTSRERSSGSLRGDRTNSIPARRPG